MKVLPNVPVVFEGRMPEGFVNAVDGWSFPRKEFDANIGKLLTLDIDFGEQCSLDCPWCFRKSGAIDASDHPTLSYQETINLVIQAKELGLKNVKFLGAGEPFENSRFLNLLRAFRELEIQSAIFTKGHVLGNDDLARLYFGKQGIVTAEQLVKEVADLGVSILLSFQSFDTRFQDSLVNVDGYTLMRNRAIELMAKAGLSQHNPAHLALIALPVTKATIDEVFEIYRWGRERNMHVIVCPSMCSGRSADEEYQRTITPSPQSLIDLYSRVYEYNLEKGIQTPEQIEAEGISAYAGSAPCHQVACGMYVTSRGIVLRCPGDDVTVLGDIREKPLVEIWEESENYRRRGAYNCQCPPKDGKTIPKNLYDEVFARVLSK